MPTYEYKCNKCEEVFEVFQKITDEPLKECPMCGGEIKRLVSGGAGIIFKGSGFYTTDYKKSSLTKTTAKTGEEKKSSTQEPTQEPKQETKKETVASETKKDTKKG
jgi:putative FmdB family regulatory protein